MVRQRSSSFRAVLVGVLALWSQACAGHASPGGVSPEDPRAFVPDASARLEANPSDSGWAERLQTATVCLVRTGTAAGCRDSTETPLACDPRSAAEVHASLEDLFKALPRITLSSPFTAADSVHAVLPSAIVTRAVGDARRQVSCSDWKAGPPCIALTTQGVWAVLYRTAPAPGPAQHVEIFLTAPGCRSDVHP